jgi:hypothetical protein
LCRGGGYFSAQLGGAFAAGVGQLGQHARPLGRLIDQLFGDINGQAHRDGGFNHLFHQDKEIGRA